MIREYIDRAIENAGGYTKGVENSPAMNMGITLNVLTEYRGHKATLSDLQHLTRAEAEQITYERLWSATGFAGLEVMDFVLKSLFETAVDFGPLEAVIVLQRSLDLTPDGELGVITKQAAERMKPEVLVSRIEGRTQSIKQRLRA